MRKMIYIVILVLSLLTDGTRGGCPLKCNCTDNSLNCVSKNLEYIPYFESLSNNPLIIDLSGNAISTIDIDDFSFDKSDQVKEIYLNNSGVIIIEEGAFEELENLQELYLSDNLLNALPENFIENNENMVLLDLSSNYFEEMPKIRSESLEVLTIANSGISKMSSDALDALPNLRILLLPQNNLKTINPVIFDDISNLFFIRIAYNPWRCNCKTVKLFDYLTERQFVDLTESVQCLTEEKIFVDIYSDRGVAPHFEQCSVLDHYLDDSEEELKLKIINALESEDSENVKISLKNLEAEESNVTVTTPSNENSTRKTSDDFHFHVYYLVILSIAIVLSLIIGAACGSCITFKYMNRSIKQTESRKELLAKFDENISPYNFT